MKRFFLIAGLAAVASASQATGTFVAYWQYGLNGHSSAVKVKLGATNYNVSAGEFTARRLKDAAGGTSLDLPMSTTNPNYDFIAKTFCVELTESINVNTNHTHNVVAPLLGATTQNGGVTFDATRVTALSRLWANASITDSITAAAFQLVQWEITFDGGSLDLTGGTFRNNGTVNAAIITQANTWLGQLGSWTAQRNLVLLSRAGIQDQITALDGLPPTNVVPEPFTMGLGVAAAGAFVRRRLKARSV
jgi:hypothetical protein